MEAQQAEQQSGESCRAHRDRLLGKDVRYRRTGLHHVQGGTGTQTMVDSGHDVKNERPSQVTCCWLYVFTTLTLIWPAVAPCPTLCAVACCMAAVLVASHGSTLSP